MADINLKELKRLAEAATFGKWEWWTSNSELRLSTIGRTGFAFDGGVIRAEMHATWPDIACKEEDKAFIIATQPQVILELIERLERAEAAIPEGWKPVPIEPTKDMVIHGFESVPHYGFDPEELVAEYESLSGCQQAAFRARRCYAAMLNAVPKP